MLKKKTQIVNTVKTVLICEKCRKKIAKMDSFTCSCCGINLCNSCSTFWFNDPNNGDSFGDYPKTVCSDCNNFKNGGGGEN